MLILPKTNIKEKKYTYSAATMELLHSKKSESLLANYLPIGSHFFILLLIAITRCIIGYL